MKMKKTDSFIFLLFLLLCGFSEVAFICMFR